MQFCSLVICYQTLSPDEQNNTIIILKITCIYMKNDRPRTIPSRSGMRDPGSGEKVFLYKVVVAGQMKERNIMTNFFLYKGETKASRPTSYINRPLFVQM